MIRWNTFGGNTSVTLPTSASALMSAPLTMIHARVDMNEIPCQ